CVDRCTSASAFDVNTARVRLVVTPSCTLLRFTHAAFPCPLSGDQKTRTWRASVGFDWVVVLASGGPATPTPCAKMRAANQLCVTRRLLQRLGRGGSLADPHQSALPPSVAHV